MSEKSRMLVIPKLQPGKIYRREELLRLFLTETNQGTTSFYHFTSECIALGIIEKISDYEFKVLKVKK